MKTQNKRFAPWINSQFPVPISIIYRGQDSAGQGVVQELSRVGCRIIGNDPVVAGETLSVWLSLSTSQKSLFTERTTVQWIKGLEFGLAFQRLQLREADRLQHLLDALRDSGSDSGRSSRTLNVMPSFEMFSEDLGWPSYKQTWNRTVWAVTPQIGNGLVRFSPPVPSEPS